MNVEINLLREKPKAHPIFRILIYLLVAILLANAVFIYVKYSSVSSEIEMLETKIKSTETERIALEAKINNMQSDSFINEYKQDVNVIKAFHFSSVGILNDFVRVLPERGFFIDYTFSENGIVDVFVKFDTLPEMSMYTDGLSSLPFVTNVSLDDVEIKEISNNENEVLPRFYVQYSISLDIETVKAVQAEQEGEA
jgi:type IV pilus assembly protein PilN